MNASQRRVGIMGLGRLVNVGQGAHVVEQDLLAALNEGRVGGAVLDVLAHEPPSPNSPFLKHPRILLTPHITSDVQVEGGVAVIVENLRREREWTPFLNLVDPSRGYQI